MYCEATNLLLAKLSLGLSSERLAPADLKAKQLTGGYHAETAFFKTVNVLSTTPKCIFRRLRRREKS